METLYVELSTTRSFVVVTLHCRCDAGCVKAADCSYIEELHKLLRLESVHRETDY